MNTPNNIKLGDWVKAEPTFLQKKLGFIIEGEIIQIVTINPENPLVLVKYDTGRRGKRKFETFALKISDIQIFGEKNEHTK